MENIGLTRDAGKCLSEQQIYPCNATGSFICAKPGTCGSEISFCRKSFLQHLTRGGHKVSLEERVLLWQSAQQCAALFPDMHPLREPYLKGGARHGQLPPIQGLPVVHALESPECDMLFEGESTLRNHGKSTHGCSTSRRALRPLRKHLCQSLSRKKGSKTFFLVQSHSSPEQNAIGAQSKLSAAVASYDPGEVLSNHIPTYSDRDISGFLSMAKCEDRLEAHGLTLQDAYVLTTMYPPIPDRMDVQNALKGVTRSIEGCMRKSRNLFKSVDCFRSTLLEIASSGALEKTKAFRFLNDNHVGDRTQRRYARSARLLVVVACRVFVTKEKFPKVHISSELHKALEEFLSLDPEDVIAQQEKVYRVLCAVYFEEIRDTYSSQTTSNIRGSTSLFASVVVACMCVTGEYPSRLRFKKGIQVASDISGILYTASCCELLESNRSMLSAEIRQRRFNMIRDMMNLDVKGGIQLFIDLRSICATVRNGEVRANRYHPCPLHDFCGIVRGLELGTVKVGECVRAMQSDLRKLIFDNLLQGASGPPNLRDLCAKLVDDDDNVVTGYWALSEPRNAECRMWTCENILSDRNVEEMEGWRNTATNVVPLLISVVHLVSRAPSRGTELGTLALRNTWTQKRSIFFVCGEVMIVPTYNKSKNIRDGLVDFISRHLGEETSFLFTVFFLLIHPVIIGIARIDEEKETVPAGEVGVEILKRRNELRNNVLLGTIAPEKVAEQIGTVFSKYKLGLSFSMYRHWQRGYAKHKESDSFQFKSIMISTSTEGYGDDFSHPFITQGGHTMRTAGLHYAKYSGHGNAEHLVELYRVAV